MRSWVLLFVVAAFFAATTIGCDSKDTKPSKPAAGKADDKKKADPND
jgi:hypothetical protein